MGIETLCQLLSLEITILIFKKRICNLFQFNYKLQETDYKKQKQEVFKQKLI